MPGLRPIPYDIENKRSLWTAGAARLVIADAIGACTGDWATAAPSYVHPDDDPDWWSVAAQMGEAMRGCGADPGSDDKAVARWKEFRSDPDCNRDPSSSEVIGKKYDIGWDGDSDAASLTAGLIGSGAFFSDMTLPSYNLCVATRIRQAAPGAAGAEAIVMSEAEQRELVAFALERITRSLTGFGVLGIALAPHKFTVPPPPPNSPIPEVPGLSELNDRLRAIHRWANDDNPGYLADRKQTAKMLGQDFAAAMQLHSVLAQEMTDLLGRNASARSPRGGTASTFAEELWGPGSWRQRAMTSLFGGFPFAAEPSGDVPWTDPNDKTSPSLWGDSWPTHARSPFPRHEIRGPEPALFGNLTKMLPSIELRTFKPLLAECASIDRKASGDALYRAVELQLRRSAGVTDCSADPEDECVQVCTPKEPPPLTAGFDEYLLWTRYGLRPEHAEAYVSYLADFLEPVCTQDTTSAVSGLANVPGAIRFGTGGPVSTNLIYLDPAASLVPKSLEQRAGAYTRFMPWRMPDFLSFNAPAWQQGFPRFGDPNLRTQWSSAYPAAGHLGTISAEVAVRDALHAMDQAANAKALDLSGSPTTHPGPSLMFKEFASPLGRLLTLSTATAGEQTVSIRPRAKVVSPDAVRPDCTFRLSGTVCKWDLDIVTSDSEEFFQDATGLSVVAISNRPWAGSLAATPGSTAFGRTIADLASGSAAALKDITQPREMAAGLRRQRATIIVSTGAAVEVDSREWTFVARRAAPSGGYDFRLVTDHVQLRTPNSLDQGQYIASSGALGTMAQRLMLPLRDNPVEPHYDGFGLPTRWVPPTDPNLFGGTAGETAVSHYLSTAKAQSQEAAIAVQGAMEVLLEQQMDEAEQDAADKRAAKVNELELASLCGSANPTCNGSVSLGKAPMLQWKDAWISDRVDAGGTAVGLYDVCLNEAQLPNTTSSLSREEINHFTGAVRECIAGGYEDLAACAGFGAAAVALNFIQSFSVSEAGMGGAALDPMKEPEAIASVASMYCDSMRLVSVFAGQDGSNAGAYVDVAQPVLELIDAPVQPSFSEYAGGSLQSAFIEQWAALRSFRLLGDEFVKASDAAGLEILHAHVVAKHASEAYHRACNPAAAADAKASCWSYSCGFPLGCSVSYSPAPVINYNASCEQLALAVGPTIVQAQATQAEALARIAAYGQRFAEAAKQVQLSSATVAQLVQATKSAMARNDLEKALVADTQKTSFGLYRRYHSYDLWRAKALLESARRYGVAARRAVEARFAVDLSAMNAPEPFVAAPTLWADEIYAYDLSLPAAVGLTVGQAQQGGIYSNKVYDYVGNLERFVNGYAVQRPSSTAQQDTEIVSLPGPFAKRQVEDPCTQTTSWIPSSEATAWTVYCPATEKWVSPIRHIREEAPPVICVGDDEPLPPNGCGAGNPEYVLKPEWQESPCGDNAAPPTRARIEFFLDPWGRLNDLIADVPYQHRYNARWIKLAVNLVGGEVLDCTGAADVAQCMSDRVVRYDLIHTGPSWLTTYDRGWHLLGSPNAYVEGGKAIAANQWLSPLLSSWSQPHVEAAARTEFAERPLGGAYALEIQLNPEVRLDRVERVQILAATTYWVGQD